MNISTVNELIASLESAGELSIRERKFLKLAKAYQELAAENVLLAAENKMAVDAVTVFSNVTHDVTEIICDELGHDRVAEIVAAYNDLGNMPATDRIVAGIKADGVEEFIGRLQQCVDEGDFVGDEVDVIVGAIDCGKEFCEQLREGADK
ncbi:hypothetical protein ACXEGA_004302 [Klebsiella pneumoniae]|nr:hypothetical protein [Klebsiella pneumoniae]